MLASIEKFLNPFNELIHLGITLTAQFLHQYCIMQITGPFTYASSEKADMERN
jgi:hypothetical protein